MNTKGDNAVRRDENHESGSFDVFEALSVDSFQARKIEIFLPRDLETNGPFPVIYMNDGNTSFHPGGLSPNSWEVPSTLSRLYAEQRIPHVIVVAVYPLNRAHEYLHVMEFSGLRKEGGGLPDYAEYLTRLKGFIDSRYPTQKNREATTVVGSSHGGLAAFFTAAMHGECFGNGGVCSPSFWVGGVLDLRKSELIRRLGEYLLPANPNRPRLWIDWGLNRRGGLHNFLIERQATKWGREMVSLLQEDYGYVLGRDVFMHEDKIGGHDERAWAYRFGLLVEQFYGSDTSS